MGFVIGWLVNFFFILVVIGIISFQLICITDLEFDYVNPYDSSNRINMMVLPEYIAQAVLCLAFLLNGLWLMALLSLPYLFYNVKLYTGKRHLLYAAEIYNQLPREKTTRLYKLGFLVSLLVISLFWFLWKIAADFSPPGTV